LSVAALMLIATGLFAGAVISVRGSAASPSQLERDIPPLESNVLAETALSTRAVRKQMPIPVRIFIPAIGVNTSLIPLGLNRDRTVRVPRSFASVGWFRPGPEPGESGAAVILGHVDSKSGPGAFYRLRALRRGDIIKITPRTGQRLRFVVIGSRAVPKKRFPTKLIYRKTGWPALRLITCDGRFDSSTGHYVDNYVVFARLIARR
jgi:sortase (surface protein transpeptidase)